jgi:hypothetical protein
MMAETGDLIQEFKNAKPPEKAVIIGGVVAIVGIAWYLHSKSQASQGATGQGDQSATQSQVSGWPTVGPNQTPVLPQGYNPIFDPSGNLVGYGPSTPTPSTNVIVSSKPTQYLGGAFLGPSGVNHYTATGNQTLSQIASQFGLTSWNSIYAIPANQQLFGNLNSTQAANYKPTAGTTITLPGGTAKAGGAGKPMNPASDDTIPASTSGYAHGTKGLAMANSVRHVGSSREHSQVARTYSQRIGGR